jgi:twitching motility protein PilT
MVSTRTLRTLTDLLVDARRRGASDVHIVPGAPPFLRIAGALAPVDGAVLTSEDSAHLIGELLNDAGASDSFERFLGNRRELDCGLRLDGIGRVRCNVFYDRGSIAAAFRLVPAEVPPLDELRLPAIVRHLIARPAGLLIVTGAAGHGKTTTQAAMIRAISEQSRVRIITIEDPIEYDLPHGRSLISQREVGCDTPSFSDGLRAALREDPNVILIGEMRDLETISTALTAAETGHLIIATLHTNDAPGAVDRITDAFPPNQQAQVRAQLSETLLAVIAQRLVPLQGRSAMGRLELRGRVPACEILLGAMAGVGAVRGSIREGKTVGLYSIMETSRDRGMQTMETALAELVKRNLISRETAMQAAIRQDALQQLFHD